MPDQLFSLMLKNKEKARLETVLFFFYSLLKSLVKGLSKIPHREIRGYRDTI